MVVAFQLMFTMLLSKAKSTDLKRLAKHWAKNCAFTRVRLVIFVRRSLNLRTISQRKLQRLETTLPKMSSSKFAIVYLKSDLSYAELKKT